MFAWSSIATAEPVAAAVDPVAAMAAALIVPVFSSRVSDPARSRMAAASPVEPTTAAWIAPAFLIVGMEAPASRTIAWALAAPSPVISS